MLVGVILPVGRVAGDRPELFVGSGVQTPSEGIALLPEHRSTTVVMRFDPIRDADGSLRVDHLLPDTPEGQAIAASVRSGKTPGLVCRVPQLDSETRVSGVREVRHSLITAVATVPSQSTTRRAPKSDPRGGACGFEMALDAAARGSRELHQHHPDGFVRSRAGQHRQAAASGNEHRSRLLPPVVGCRVFVRGGRLPVVRCPMYCPRSGGDSVGSAGTAHGSKAGSSLPLTDSADCRAAGTRSRQIVTIGRRARW